MNPSKSRSFALALLAVFFTLSFSIGCNNKKEEKKETPTTPKMDTGNTKPIVPATVAPPAN
jgi:hypothetical protein